MSKKIAICLTLAMMLSATTVFAYSTVYTDEIGRHHFLGKDPGSASAQAAAKYENYNNNVQKDVTDVIYKDESVNKFNNSLNETKVNTTTSTEDALKGYFNHSKKPVSTSEFKMPFTSSGVNDSKTIYTDDIGRMHFFTKDSRVEY